MAQQPMIHGNLLAMVAELKINAENLQDRVQQILQSVARQRLLGKAISDEEVLAQYPQLSEPLASGLAKLRLIEQAGIKANEPEHPDTGTSFSDGTPRAPCNLRIRCPHCRASNQIASDASLADIVCQSCGSHFNLAETDEDSHTVAALQTLAHFDLVKRLGMGSFGTVWKGHDKSLDRTVAVKIPRQGAMSAQETEKFLREARAVAQLKHPHIVSVHEVGRDGDVLFIVSDYVQGLSLDDWLISHQPTMRQVAELCATMAAALHHAHEQGVIHRDLKPANIMIDGDGQPHLMDFGLARRDAGEITMTLDGQVLGTPAYMSPEQARGDAHTADRRSDTYSLGVVLFQLLTGELPFRGNARMLIHQVLHDEPPSPRKFNANIPRDLETITLKCLEKEPAKRYQTTEDVGEELGRWLRHEPISARPVGFRAKVWRWAKRKPMLATLAASTAASFLIGTVVSLVFAAQAHKSADDTAIALQEANQQRRLAQSVNAFFTDEVFGLADPARTDNPNMSLRDALKLAAEQIDEYFPKDEDLQLALRSRVGQILATIDEPELAITQLRNAVDRSGSIYGATSQESLRANSLLAYAYYVSGRDTDAITLFEDTLARQSDSLSDTHPDTLRTAIWLSSVLRETGTGDDLQLARKTYEDALGSLGPDHELTVEAQNALAWSLRWNGQVEEALKHAQQSTSGLTRLRGSKHHITTLARYNYASCLQRLGRTDEAVQELKALLEDQRNGLGATHTSTLWTVGRLISILIQQQRLEEAKRMLLELRDQLPELRSRQSALGARPLAWIVRSTLSLNLTELAIEIQQLLYDLRAKEFGSNDVRTLDAQITLASLYLRHDERSKALALANIACDQLNSLQLIRSLARLSLEGDYMGSVVEDLEKLSAASSRGEFDSLLKSLKKYQ